MPITGLAAHPELAGQAAALETARPAPDPHHIGGALRRHPGANVLNLIEDMLDAEADHPNVVIFCPGGRRARPMANSRIDRLNSSRATQPISGA